MRIDDPIFSGSVIGSAATISLTGSFTGSGHIATASYALNSGGGGGGTTTNPLTQGLGISAFSFNGSVAGQTVELDTTSAHFTTGVSSSQASTITSLSSSFSTSQTALSSSFSTSQTTLSASFSAGSVTSASYALTASHIDGVIQPPGGANTQVQYNNAGVFAGDANFTFDNATGDANINGLTIGKGLASIVSNTAFGVDALDSNTTGGTNTAIGSEALTDNTTGGDNTAVGSRALANNISAGDNTAVGSGALSNSNFGFGNTAIGSGAGNNISAGQNNTIIGNGSQASIPGATNEVTLGDSAITTLRCQVTSITALSDKRDKTDIETISEGVDFLKSVRPVSFTWDTRDGKKVGKKAVGFIAQELREAQDASSIAENLDLVYTANEDKLEITQGHLVPVLVKAIQELTNRLEILENQ